MEENERKALLTLRREMEEMRAEYEKKLAALAAQPARAEEEAEKAKKAEEERRRQEARKAQEDWLNEYVEIRLFRDNERYRDDVYVAINGQNCVIRRGVWTRVRRKFALLLDQSEIQDLRTAELMEREENRFANESRRRFAGEAS